MKYRYLRVLSGKIATLGGIGTVAYAPGTCAAYITLGYVGFLSLFSMSISTQILGICCSILGAYTVIYFALPLFNNETDPSAIVIDEVVGTLVTFIGIAISLKMLFIGFVLFRFFDILKPFGINRIERLGGALGILADDIVAGLYANIMLHIYLWIFL